jgi:glycerol-3-phosphate dehydrogenase
VRRDLRSLSGTGFDVLVVGAGIYGATIAWEAAQRGLSVALVDRGDFGGATSFNSLKTVHGGLRSLQRGSLSEMREFIRERRSLLRIAPHLVHPLRFLVPTYGFAKRSRLVMATALAINDLVARDRNAGLDPALHLAPSCTISREETPSASAVKLVRMRCWSTAGASARTSSTDAA